MEYLESIADDAIKLEVRVFESLEARDYAASIEERERRAIALDLNAGEVD